MQAIITSNYGGVEVLQRQNVARPAIKDKEIFVLVENGKLAPLIEKTYHLEQVQEAHTRSETGRVVGKLVLKVV